VTEIVVDASLVLSLALPDELVDPVVVVGHLAAARPVAPELFGYEVANALRTARLRNRLSQAQAEQVGALIDRLGVELVGSPPTVELTNRSLEWGLSAYDGAYLLLALHRGCPLATCDAHLAEAAEAAGVQLIPFR
jgi:predicted nucleic acid-binding protein